MNLKRIVFDQLSEAITPNKVILLYGPRRVGKTFLLKELIEKYKDKYKIKYVTGDSRIVQNDLSSQNLEKLKMFLGDADLLIVDEAQNIPEIGLNLKIIVDEIKGINVIASGSASFDLAQKVGEPLTGRKKTLKLFPISTKEIMTNFDSLYQQETFEEQLIFGGYPELFSIKGKKEKTEYLRELVDSILLKDILAMENIRNAKKLIDLLTLLAFQIGNEVSLNELSKSLELHKNTVFRYLDLLEKTFVIFNIRGFSRNLRKEVTKTSKYYFYDNGIRNTIINNFNELNLRQDVGMLWENFLVIERLKKQSYDSILSNNYFWRTYDQKEIDWVEERDGKLLGYEFKWNAKSPPPPKGWLETYENAEYQVVNQQNYLDFIL